MKSGEGKGVMTAHNETKVEIHSEPCNQVLTIKEPPAQKKTLIWTFSFGGGAEAGLRLKLKPSLYSQFSAT